MPLFLSTYTNKVDKKGRISVPAAFRGEIEKAGYNGFIAFPHPELKCIEAWDRERMARYAQGMDEFSPMSAEYAAVSTIMSRSRELTFDPEGRVAVPDYMLDDAKLKDAVIFAGRGQTFQIWSPKEFEAYDNESAARAAENREKILLPPQQTRLSDE